MAKNSTHVRASRASVFAVLADGWTYSNWVVGTSHMRAVQTAWPATGAKLFHCSGAWPLAARDETEVESCDPGHRLVLMARGRPFGVARIVIDLEDEAGGCRISMDETPVGGPGRWIHNPVADAFLRRRNTESLARLTAMAESRESPQD